VFVALVQCRYTYLALLFLVLDTFSLAPIKGLILYTAVKKGNKTNLAEGDELLMVYKHNCCIDY